MRELGVIAETKDIDACFDEYDEDGGGSLDINELKPALKKLALAANKAELLEMDVEKQATAKRKEAKKAMGD